MRNCSVEGCEKPGLRRGLCGTHYQRWRRHGDPYVAHSRPPGLTAKQVVDRELGRAEKGPDGCLLTTAYRNAAGHGVVTFADRQHLLHRLALQVHLDRKLEENEQANHRCHRPACINPEHLYVGTQAENIEHYRSAGLTAARKLTIDQVREIRKGLAQGVSRRELAAQLGITEGNVRLIERGVTWRDVS